MKSTFSSMDSEMGKIGAMISLSLSLSHTHIHCYTCILSHTREMYIQRDVVLVVNYSLRKTAFS